MKCIYILFIFGLTLPLISQNPSLKYAQFEIIYGYEMNSDQKNDRTSHKYDADYKVAQEKLKKMEARLIFNQIRSIYTTPELFKPTELAEIMVFGAVMPDQTFYYNRLGNHLVHKKVEFGIESIIKYDQVLEWEITNETAIISGLLCQKAYGTQKIDGFNDSNFTVWYAPEIPFPFGPLTINGLPGVILKFKFGGITIKARRIKRISEHMEPIEFPDFEGIPTFSESVR